MKITRTKIALSPIPLPPRKPLWKRSLEILGIMLGCITAYALIMLVVFEFMVGCGERTYYADGTWETNACLFIPYTPAKGTW